ncbi:MAG: hypothetical protein ABL930_09315 [Pseudobdellovibrio sp.]
MEEPLSNLAKSYFVPFSTSFSRFEKDINPKEYPPEFIFFAPRSELASEVTSKKYFSLNGKDYESYTESVVYKPNNEPVYKTNYLIELPLRRIDKIENLKNTKLSVVFVGCSHTFGEGVNYEQSLPGLFAKKYPCYNVYNVSARGVSLAQHLFHLKRGDHFLNTPLGSDIILIYTYTEDHIFRESCSTACLSESNQWRLYSPRY